MKYNLENFPVKGTPQDYERWGKGFKKELRERLLEEEAVALRHGLTTSRAIIKEILGETDG